MKATLHRRDVVVTLLEDRGDLLVVAGLGSAAWDCAAAGDHELTFPLWGAMGNAAMVGLGYAWQLGLVPVSFEALARAIELNGAAVEMNKKAFAWGRMAAHDINAVKQAAGITAPPEAADFTGAAAALATSAAFVGEGKLAHSLDETIALRAKFLTEYQDAAYAAQYTAFVIKVRAAEDERTPGLHGLAEATARYLFKLMAYKDEYEVARLYTTGDFEKRIRDTFDGDFKLHFNLAPPMFSKKDHEGHLVKQEYGPWVFTAFKLLKKLKFLRGGAFDVFGKTEERRMERQLIVDYRNTVAELINGRDGFG